MAKTVKDLLETKSKEVCTIGPGDLVYDAIVKMAAKQIGALAVVEGGRVVGIITERDYARKVIIQNKSSKSTTVRSIMTERVIYVRPDQTIEECMALMTDKRIRHLPVLADSEILGVLSIGDLVKAKAKTHELHIRTLEAYISDKYPGPA